MIVRLLVTSVAALALAACGKPGAPAADAAAKPTDGAASAPVLLLGPEDLRRVTLSGAAGGAVITGSIQPEKRADLRAEVAAVVTQVLKDNGEPVKRGELLTRLDDASIRESLQSADASARAAQQAFEQAQRQVERQKTLQAQGMTSMQALDDAEGRRIAARVVAAQQQLRRTEVRAPFDGVVSDRKASVGDTAQVGKELMKVIDPRSMRFEGLVSADRMGDVKLGQAVTFRVNGVEGVTFNGTVQRIDSAANAVTRQVAVLVAFDDATKAPRVAGLYAEGQLVGGAAAAQPMLPESVLVRSPTGGAVHVWRVGKDAVLAKVPVQVGERDPRSGDVPLKAGLADGDTILRSPGASLVDGQRVEFSAKERG
jgi:membrane fusion protein (multidrug efflux system)